MPNIVCLVAGDGTDRRRLVKKDSYLDIRNRVISPGFIPEEEKVAH